MQQLSDLFLRDLSRGLGFLKRLAEHWFGKRVFVPNIENSAEDIGHRNSEEDLLLSLRYGPIVKAQDLWNSDSTTKRRWHGDIEFGRIYIRELMETESGVMTIDAYRPIAPITRPKPP